MVFLGSIAAGALAVAATLFVSGAHAAFEQDCAGLASTLMIENATMWSSEVIKAGTNITFPQNNVTCQRPGQVVSVDICRVALYVATSPRSGISMEAWLPRNWTGRFLSTGNGGISGCIQYEDMAYTAGLGFSTVGANNGHNGTGGTPFLNNRDVVLDFSWRSLHTNVVVGKQISHAFYHKPHSKAYYLGCSTGGRQGFQNAQTFPDDFDGIVAGAPAIRFNYLNSWSGYFYPLLHAAGPSGFPPPSTWDALDAALLEQCDTFDGAADGILEDHSLCNFRPETLICADPSTSTRVCITGAQAATVRAIFSDLYGENGTFIYPRMQPGPGILAAVYTIYSRAQFPYTADWFKYAVYNSDSFNADTLGPANYAFAWNSNPGQINSWNGDLAPFKKSGGKILHYHGGVDQIISSTISPLYYDHVSRTMNLPSSALDDFYRLFRISGMGHCGGGPGATFIGNKLATTASLAPEGNVLMAMVRWVEQGVAPDTIEGTKYVNDTASLGVEFKRRHCRYPKRNVFVGGKNGDWRDDGLWECVM